MLLFFLLSSSCRYVGPMIFTFWTDVGTWSHILDMGTAVSPQKLKCCKTNVAFVCFSTWCDVGWMQRWLVTRWLQKDVRISLVFHIGLRESKLFCVILDKVYCIFQVIKAESIARASILVFVRCWYAPILVHVGHNILHIFWTNTICKNKRPPANFLIPEEVCVSLPFSFLSSLCTAIRISPKFPHDYHVSFLSWKFS